MSDMGHNSNAIRLAELAGAAREGLTQVAEGEADAVQGWLAYGAALNEGRKLFPGDKEFGRWIAGASFDNLSLEPNEHERVAAMWADKHRRTFALMFAAGKARTVRGIHAKWKEDEAAREREERKKQAAEEAAKRKAEAEAAKAETKARADEEAAARRAAETAKDDEERKAAGEKAETAAAALAAAEEAAKAAEEAVAELEPSEPEEDPATAKLRAEYRKLTDEAREDDWIGLRAEVADAKKRVADQRSTIADLKAKLKEVTSDDLGRALGNVQRQRDQINGRLQEIMAEKAKSDRYIRALKAENADLKQRLENQVIPL